MKLHCHLTSTTGRAEVLHTFHRLGDGAFIALFEAHDLRFAFRPQHASDLHLALEVDASTLAAMHAKGIAAEIETRGIPMQGFIDPICLRDPDGSVVELCTGSPAHDRATEARP